MANTIVHFEIPADDPEKLAEYYRGLFGWKVQHQPEMNYWMIETVSTDAQGRPTEPGVNGGIMRRIMPEQRIMNYVGVESVDEAAARAASLGGSVLLPRQAVPGMGWFAVCQDPQGNLFGVFQEDPEAK